MSNTNGTALGSSANPADGVESPPANGHPAHWLAGIEDTAPLDTVDRPNYSLPELEASQRHAGNAKLVKDADQGRRRGSEADQVEAELAEAGRLVAIQMHPLLLQRMTSSERKAAQRSAQKVRTALREEQEAAELASVQRRVKARKLETELADQDAADRRWHRRAESARQRLTSPASRLADLFRSRQRLIRALMAVAMIGVAWGAVNVHDILAAHFTLQVFDPGFWLAYGVEPLVTVPLIVLMAYQSKLAEWGRQTHWRNQWPVRLVELVLLLAALAMNAVPHFNDGAAALIYVVPPAMIAVSMFVVPIVAAQLGEIMLEARDDAAEAAGLADDESALNKFIARLTTVFDAAGKGEIGGERDERGVPSAASIARHQNIAKGTAITIRKLWSAARS